MSSFRRCRAPSSSGHSSPNTVCVRRTWCRHSGPNRSCPKCSRANASCKPDISSVSPSSSMSHPRPFSPPVSQSDGTLKLADYNTAIETLLRVPPPMGAIGSLPWCQRPGRPVMPDPHLTRGQRVALGERAATVAKFAVCLRSSHFRRHALALELAGALTPLPALACAALDHAAAIVVVGRYAVAHPPVQTPRTAILAIRKVLPAWRTCLHHGSYSPPARSD